MLYTKTCGNKWNENCITCQAVCNLLRVIELPKEFKDIRRVEKVLIARRLHFKKISIMFKGRSPKLKGPICNLPLDFVNVSNTLPRPADSNGVAIVKPKGKLQYRGHVYFESVRPNFICRLGYCNFKNKITHCIIILE